MTHQIVMDVYCLVPYRTEGRCKVAPLLEPAFGNREVVLAFKNGRAMKDPSRGSVSFKRLTRSIVSACQGSPLAARASDTLWVPVPRSGESKPSFDPRGDKYPCYTLASQLAARLGGTLLKIFDDHRGFAPKKHDVTAGIRSLRISAQIPPSTMIVLVDDTFVTGATLMSCAAVLRNHGFRGKLAAFCVGYDVAAGEATKAHPNKTWRQITWEEGRSRPEKTAIRVWDPE